MNCRLPVVFKKFQQDESGVATIDFAIITAMSVVLGLGMSQALLNETRAFATEMASALRAVEATAGGNGGGDSGNGNNGGGNNTGDDNNGGDNNTSTSNTNSNT